MGYLKAHLFYLQQSQLQHLQHEQPDFFSSVILFSYLLTISIAHFSIFLN